MSSGGATPFTSIYILFVPAWKIPDASNATQLKSRVVQQNEQVERSFKFSRVLNAVILLLSFSGECILRLAEQR